MGYHPQVKRWGAAPPPLPITPVDRARRRTQGDVFEPGPLLVSPRHASVETLNVIRCIVARPCDELVGTDKNIM